MLYKLLIIHIILFIYKFNLFIYNNLITFHIIKKKITCCINKNIFLVAALIKYTISQITLSKIDISDSS
jgi:hypothetical protein